jgi:uncharacterized delta-60 repeat protein
MLSACGESTGLQLVRASDPGCGAACGKTVVDAGGTTSPVSLEPDLLQPNLVEPDLRPVTVDPTCAADPVTGLDLCFGPGGLAAPWTRSQSPDAPVFVSRNGQWVTFDRPADSGLWNNASSLTMVSGKLVTSGQRSVMRFLADGQPDPGFAPIMLPDQSFGTTSTVDTLGRILVGGWQPNGGGCWVRRYLDDGSEDAVLTMSGDCSLTAMAAAEDGSVVAAGHQDGALLVIRVGTDGQLAWSVQHDLTTDRDRASAIALHGGKIVVAGNTTVENANDRHGFLVRLDAGGAIDSTFANGSVQLLPYSDTWTLYHTLMVLPDGKLLVGGDTVHVGLLLRFTADGVLDTSFSGTKGRGWSAILSVDYIHSLTLDGDGRVVAGCQTYGEGPGFGVIIRFEPDSASEDASWKRIAFETHNFDSDVAALRIQPDGKLLVAGTLDGRLLLARFFGD